MSGGAGTSVYRDLDENRIIITLERLWRRICERFPESGLSHVAAELLVVARESRAKIDQSRRPLWGIRILAAAIIGLGAVAVAAVGASLEISPTVGGSLADLIQGGVAAVNALLLMAGALARVESDSLVAGADTDAVPVVAVPRLLLRAPVAHQQTCGASRSIPQRSRSA